MNMFTETPLVRRKLRQERIAKWIFFGMAAVDDRPAGADHRLPGRARLAVAQPELSD